MKKLLLLAAAIAFPTLVQAQIKTKDLNTGSAPTDSDFVVGDQSNTTIKFSMPQLKTYAQNGAVLTANLGSGVPTALGNAANASGGLLTYGAIGAQVEAWNAKLDTLAGSNPFTAGNGITFSGTWPALTISATTPIVSATASGTNIYTASPSPALSSYATGMTVFITFTNANTGGASLNLNSLGAAPIHQNGGAVGAGQIPAGSTIQLLFDGTNFNIVGNDPGGISFSTGLTVSGGTVTVAYGTTAGSAAQGNDTRITGALQTSALGTGVQTAAGNTLDGTGGLASHAALIAAGSATWTTVDASMLNTTGTDGNPAFALVPGHNYILDQSSPFELALPDPSTATNLPIRLRDANNSNGPGAGYTVTNDASGTGAGSFRYQDSEYDFFGGGSVAIGIYQNDGDMQINLGTGSSAQPIWIANSTTSPDRILAYPGSTLTLLDSSHVTIPSSSIGNLVVQPSGTSSAAVPFSNGSGNTSWSVLQPSSINMTSSGILGKATTGSGTAGYMSNVTTQTFLAPSVTLNTTGTITFVNSVGSQVIYNNSGTTLSTATITLPTSSFPGQECIYATAGAVTALTVSGTLDVGTSPSSLAAKTVSVWRCSASGHWLYNTTTSLAADGTSLLNTSGVLSVNLTNAQTWSGVQTMKAPVLQDANGNVALTTSSITASTGVNNVNLIPASTTNGPSISAVGSDTNVDLKFTPKGTGNVVISANGLKMGSHLVVDSGGELYYPGGTVLTAGTQMYAPGNLILSDGNDAVYALGGFYHGVTSSATSSTLVPGFDVHTGSSTGITKTLPGPASSQGGGRQTVIYFKNQGSASVTIASATGSQIMATGSATATASITVASGGLVILFSDGTYWNQL